MTEIDVTIAVLGAGGKMGSRIIANLTEKRYGLLLCEKAESAAREIEKMGLTVTPTEKAVPQSDVVVLAVPDALISRISETVVPMMRRDATLILLDPAASYVDECLMRKDCTFVVTHPCHPALFSNQETPEAREDLFGGIAAKQDIVIALAQGREENFRLADEICRTMFAPVVNSHRITVEQMALLEPAAAEVVIATCAVLMKQALDEAVKQGVPDEAARAFLLGHVQIPLAIVFGRVASPFSDAAQIAVEVGFDKVIKDNWREVFDREALRETIHCMLHPKRG